MSKERMTKRIPSLKDHFAIVSKKVLISSNFDELVHYSIMSIAIFQVLP